MIYWYKSQLIESQTLELDINDPGLIYGATVFTTLRVYNHCLDSTLTNWQAHCHRLQQTLTTFGWPQPDWQQVRQGAQRLLEHFPVLRITIFPDGREWITGRFLPADLTEKQKHGICCSLSKFTRSLPAHKTGNYLSPWLAKNHLQSANAQEVILQDATGNWLETSTGNLWGWKDGYWWTPPLHLGILPGVMRSQIFTWVQNQGIGVREEPWTTELVQELEAIAYTNSVVEIIPIHTVVEPLGSLQYNPYHSCFHQLMGLFFS